MNDHNPSQKSLRHVQHKKLQRVALLVLLACLLLTIICISETAVEARYRLQDQIGFVITIPSATN